MTQNNLPALPPMPRPATDWQNKIALPSDGSTACGEAPGNGAFQAPKRNYRATFIGPWIIPLLSLAGWALVLLLPLKIAGVI